MRDVRSEGAVHNWRPHRQTLLEVQRSRASSSYDLAKALKIPYANLTDARWLERCLAQNTRDRNMKEQLRLAGKLRDGNTLAIPCGVGAVRRFYTMYLQGTK